MPPQPTSTTVAAPTLISPEPYRGLVMAAYIFVLWAASLTLLLNVDVSKLGLWSIAALLWQTFLYTGLFITAHDSMHGAVFPQNLKVNNLIGSVAVTLYGLFSYRSLLKKHWQHHFHPASDRDPDFHDGKHKNLLAWYAHFMTNYWSWFRLFGMAAIFNVAMIVFQIPESNLLLFWAAPAILSSFQLFYFGTYLPHQEPAGGYQDSSRARSIYSPTFWSFITCYHFGYHREHHEHPEMPWWKLPEIARRNLATPSSVE